MFKFNKTIWAFWDTGEQAAPMYIQKCLNSWRLHNPEWRLEVLSFDNIDLVLEMKNLFGENYQSIPIQALTDLIRVNLLAKYGGVWVDATCVCKKPLDVWLPSLMKSGYFAFHKPGADRELASWFMAASDDCWLPKRWVQHINPLWANYQNIEIYQWDSSPEGLDFKQSPWLDKSFWHEPQRLPYFWLHYSFAYLLTVAPGLKSVWENTPKFSADIPHFFAKQQYGQKSVSFMDVEWESGISPLYKTSYKHFRNEEGLNNPMLFIESKLI